MAESSGRRKQSSIAAVETPHNRDEEDAYLAEAIKASLEDQNSGEEKPKVSAEAADLLIDFMDDFNATG
jgi:phosphosulfolactate phosphohydrolase-like enzyme